MVQLRTRFEGGGTPKLDRSYGIRAIALSDADAMPLGTVAVHCMCQAPTRDRVEA